MNNENFPVGDNSDIPLPPGVDDPSVELTPDDVIDTVEEVQEQGIPTPPEFVAEPQPVVEQQPVVEETPQVVEQPIVEETAPAEEGTVEDGQQSVEDPGTVDNVSEGASSNEKVKYSEQQTNAVKEILEGTNEDLEYTLIHDYMGPNDDLLYSGVFNWGAFFFEELYLFHRKMYLYGFISYAIWEVGMLVTYSRGLYLMSAVFTFLLRLAAGFYASKLYTHHATKKVRKIMRNNPNASEDELSNICSRKGGRTILGIILGIVAIIAMLIVTVVIIAFFLAGALFGLGSLFAFQANKNNQQGDIYGRTEAATIIPGEVRADTSADVNETIIYEMPEGFKTGHSWKYEISLKEDVQGYNYCELVINQINNFSDPEEVSDGIYNYLNGRAKRGTVRGKGLNWYYIKEDADATVSPMYRYFYFANKGGKLYRVKYNFSKENATETCKQNMDDFIKTIEIK